MVRRWLGVLAAVSLGSAGPGIGVSAQIGPGSDTLPDLAVNYLGLSAKGSVIYQVVNQGRGNTVNPFVVDVYINGIRKDSVTHNPLPALTVQTVESNLARFTDCKPAIVRVVLDPQKTVHELSKANNERSAELTPPCPKAP